MSIKYITCVTKWSETDQYQFKHYTQIIFKENKIMDVGHHQTQLILHELIPQILLFWNYENCIHAY